MDTVGPIQREFMERALRVMKACDSQDAFKDAVGKLFREALDAIKYLEHRYDETISDVRIMTTAMQNFLGIEEGEREKIEQEDGVCMILTESEATSRFVDTCIAVMKHTENATAHGRDAENKTRNCQNAQQRINI